MVERLRYDFDNENLVLDVPQAIVESTMAETRLDEVLSSSERLVRLENGDGGARFIFDGRAFTKQLKKQPDGAEPFASHWLYTLNEVRRRTPVEFLDPNLDVEMSDGPLQDASGQQRRGMRADLAWPMPDDQDATYLATIAMRRTALQFGYVGKSIIDSVYASANLQHGAELQALDIGCCCLTTQGEDYRSHQEKVELSGHNLYNRQVVLTCLSGLVVLARQLD
jgi:hypothetical protein